MIFFEQVPNLGLCSQISISERAREEAIDYLVQMIVIFFRKNKYDSK